ncbi:DNA-binding protein, partial [Acinetobacter baumannii]|nr:DNA-binding protein [Acinetobacter baumannii]
VAKYGLSDETIRTKCISINQGTNGKHMYDPDAADAILKNQKVRRGPKRKN